jgi:hypothetical protein
MSKINSSSLLGTCFLFNIGWAHASVSQPSGEKKEMEGGQKESRTEMRGMHRMRSMQLLVPKIHGQWHNA